MFSYRPTIGFQAIRALRVLQGKAMQRLEEKAMGKHPGLLYALFMHCGRYIFSDEFCKIPYRSMQYSTRDYLQYYG